MSVTVFNLLKKQIRHFFWLIEGSFVRMTVFKIRFSVVLKQGENDIGFETQQ